MTDPLVSVVIPVFNSERWVGEAVASALEQSWPRIEVIAVDDGSTDSSLEILRRVADPRLTVIAKPHEGASQTRNRALREAQGDYIQYLDSDDVLDPGKVAVQVRRLSETPPGFVAAGAWARFHSCMAEARFTPEPIWRDLDPVEWLVTSWMGGGMMAVEAWLTPRAVADRAGPWDPVPSVADDGEYFTRVLLASSGTVFCPEARSYYRSGIGGLSGARDFALVAAQVNSLEKSTRHLLAREDSPRTREACATTLQRFLTGMYPDHRPLVARAEIRVRELGGSRLRPGGGPSFRILARIVGWKRAILIRRGLSRLRGHQTKGLRA